MTDTAQVLVDGINEARRRGETLMIVGHGSKTPWLPPAASGQLFSTAEHAGVIDYKPSELVITVASGTPLKDLDLPLGQEHQQLASEPPRFRDMGTVGGAVASGLSGPARPWRGSLRDAVLGVEMVNGLGERLTFGGQVMKNVAGYDLSRLQAGALGAYGVLLAVSLRVAPRPDRRVTLAFVADHASALLRMRSWAQHDLPITGTSLTDGVLEVRLEGSDAAVRAAMAKVGGDTVDSEAGMDHRWQKLRDRTHPFFSGRYTSTSGPDSQRAGGRRLWRFDGPPAAPLPDGAPADVLVEWGGALRWWYTSQTAARAYALEIGATAQPVGAALRLAPTAAHFAERLKTAFDPNGVFAGRAWQKPHSDEESGQESAHEAAHEAVRAGNAHAD